MTTVPPAPPTATLQRGLGLPVAAIPMGLMALRGELVTALKVSAVGVLFYYSVAHVGALTQSGEYRLFPRALSILGLAGCAALVASVPAQVLLLAAAVGVAGVLARRAVRRAGL